MKNWKLVFEDDFNGAELNRDVWVKEIGLVRNGEPQYYTDEDRNCYLQDGCLVIETLREDYKGAKFTSAAIETRDEYTWTYGRFEMKAKLPRSHVLWPAFWTLGKSIRHGVNWPRCGEIDIMEMTGGDGTRDYETIATLHFESKATGEHDERGGRDYALVNDRRLCDDFHIYAVEWTKDSFVWYFDDKIVYQCEITEDMQGAFDEPHFIILNTALENWGGECSPNENTELPQKYIVDYVRVYQEA